VTLEQVTVPYSYILDQRGMTKKLVYAIAKNKDGTVKVQYGHREYNVKPSELRRVNP